MKDPAKVVTGMLGLAALLAPAAASGQVVLTGDAGAFNAYVWRGVTLTNQFVLQPDLYLTMPAGGGSIVLGGWGSIDAGRYDDPVNDLSEGGGTSSFNATELNLWAEYSHGLGSSLTGTVGGLFYLFPNEAGLTNDVNRTVEVYGKLQAGVPLSPKLSAWYDVDKVNGLYLEGSIAQPVSAVSGFPVTLGALAGFSTGQGINDHNPGEIANFARNSLTHVDVSATGALSLGPVTLAPTVHLLILNDEFAQVTKPSVSRDVKAWAGATITWSRALTRARTTSE
ncbi:MAG TPA: TorF family putative porin [Gemmatimonadales bacterium]|nr:TorF family putative porin [Gemmatimonadales bacterium]